MLGVRADNNWLTSSQAFVIIEGFYELNSVKERQSKAVMLNRYPDRMTQR